MYENILNKHIKITVSKLLRVQEGDLQLLQGDYQNREIFLYGLFHQRWDLNNLEDWQEYTLVQLRKNIENEIIPYLTFLLSIFKNNYGIVAKM